MWDCFNNQGGCGGQRAKSRHCGLVACSCQFNICILASLASCFLDIWDKAEGEPAWAARCTMSRQGQCRRSHIMPMAQPNLHGRSTQMAPVGVVKRASVQSSAFPGPHVEHLISGGPAGAGVFPQPCWLTLTVKHCFKDLIAASRLRVRAPQKRTAYTNEA